MHKIQVSSIRIRLLLMILPLMILSLGIWMGLSYYFANQYLVKSVNETAVSISSDYSNPIRAVMNERVTQLDDLASNQIIRSNADNTQIEVLGD